MPTIPVTDESPDVRAIREIIDRQCESLSRTDRAGADWEQFAADFHPTASLYPPTPSVEEQTVEEFVDRTRGECETTPERVEERLLEADIRVFHDTATAMAAREVTEDGETSYREVEAMLFAKVDERWTIVARSWERASDENPVPEHLAG